MTYSTNQPKIFFNRTMPNDKIGIDNCTYVKLFENHVYYFLFFSVSQLLYMAVFLFFTIVHSDSVNLICVKRSRVLDIIIFPSQTQSLYITSLPIISIMHPQSLKLQQSPAHSFQTVIYHGDYL